MFLLCLYVDRVGFFNRMAQYSIIRDTRYMNIQEILDRTLCGLKKHIFIPRFWTVKENRVPSPQKTSLWWYMIFHIDEKTFKWWTLNPLAIYNYTQGKKHSDCMDIMKQRWLNSVDWMCLELALRREHTLSSRILGVLSPRKLRKREWRKLRNNWQTI